VDNGDEVFIGSLRSVKERRRGETSGWVEREENTNKTGLIDLIVY
jgi:hypothetical protein